MRTTKYKNIFFKGYAENWAREIFFIDSVLKTNLWTYIIKDINEEKNYKFGYMSYYSEPHSHIGDKVKDLPSYASKKELEHAKSIHTTDIAAKKGFYCFESWSWQTRH